MYFLHIHLITIHFHMVFTFCEYICGPRQIIRRVSKTIVNLFFYDLHNLASNTFPFIEAMIGTLDRQQQKNLECTLCRDKMSKVNSVYCTMYNYIRVHCTYEYTVQPVQYMQHIFCSRDSEGCGLCWVGYFITIWWLLNIHSWFQSFNNKSCCCRIMLSKFNCSTCSVISFS